MNGINAVVHEKFKKYTTIKKDIIANFKHTVLLLPTGKTLKLSENYGIDSFKIETIRKM